MENINNKFDRYFELQNKQMELTQKESDELDSLIDLLSNFQETQIVSTENIASSEFNHEANILTLDGVPSIQDEKRLFIDDSIVLEF